MAKMVPRRRFRVTASDAGRTLKEFLGRRCPEIPAGYLNKLMRKGYVHVDGGPAPAERPLAPGDVVIVCLPPGAYLVAPNPAVPFEIVHVDEDVIVVDKPAGVVSEPGIGHKLDSLLNGLVARFGEALDLLGPRYDYGMVHRLDKDASGLMVVARTRAAQRRLRREFSGGGVEKRYIALVAGAMEKNAGVISIPLGRLRRGGRLRGTIGGPGARRAVTRFRVIERLGDFTLLECTALTGRWHQLRLHLAAVGHPIVGDTESGEDALNARMRREYGLGRMFLHAAHLRFRHPGTGRHITFDSSLPRELEEVLGAIRRFDSFVGT